MAKKKTRNFRLYEEEDEWIDEIAEEYDVYRSTVIQRALKFYKELGLKNDLVMQEKVKDEQQD